MRPHMMGYDADATSVPQRQTGHHHCSVRVLSIPRNLIDCGRSCCSSYLAKLMMMMMVMSM